MLCNHNATETEHRHDLYVMQTSMSVCKLLTSVTV